MSNTIDLNLGENNSISSLSFHWNAVFFDGSQINQFNEDGTENLFKLVQNRFDELVYFYLTNNKEITFTVDLIHGLIFFNNHQTIAKEFKRKKDNIRLIFFRRHKVELTEQMVEKKHEIKYFLGYQYLDNNGYNKKVVLQIDKDGNFIVGD